MKKLQIMAGMLCVLLLAGCGGVGVSAKTIEDPPQTAATDVSSAAAAQNGNENPSEVVRQDEVERPSLIDAEPSVEKKTTSSAGETKPKAEDPPVQVLPAETVPPEAPSTKPSEPATDEAAPLPFDIKDQPSDLTVFDEALVKRWLKQITIWPTHCTVELKSGLKVDVER